MKALVAWRGGSFLTGGKIGVLSLTSLLWTWKGVYVGVCVCIRTHTHTLHRWGTRLWAQESGWDTWSARESRWTQSRHSVCIRICVQSTHEYKEVLKDLRWYICHLSSVEKSAGLHKFGLSAGPRFDSRRKPVYSHQHGFEHTDPRARVLNNCSQ